MLISQQNTLDDRLVGLSIGQVKKFLRQEKVIKEGRLRKKRLRPYESLYKLLSNNARRQHHQFTLTFDDFLEFTTKTSCHYCDGPVRWDTTCYNLDRVNNLGGYEGTNLVVCCIRCNRVKSNIVSYEAMVEIGVILKRHDLKMQLTTNKQVTV